MKKLIITIMAMLCISTISYGKTFELSDIKKCKSILEYGELTTTDEMDTVYFGTGSSKKGKRWLVLKKDGDAALLFSSQIEFESYFSDNQGLDKDTWKNSKIREKLNNEIYEKYFTESERNLIIDVEVETKVGNNVETTTDKLFLLSQEDVEEFFRNNNIRKMLERGGGKKYGEWWLRDLNEAQEYPKIVNSTGSIKDYKVNKSHPYYNQKGICIAFWVSCDAGYDGKKNDNKSIIKKEDIKNDDSLVNQINKAKIVEDYPYETSVDKMNGVFFGNYPQSDANGEKYEPIEWLVLEKNNDKALLITKYVLDCKPYNDEDVGTKWETCSLRSYLNNDFINKAFTGDEQNIILINDKNYNTDGKDNLYDKLFCLKEHKFNKYFHAIVNSEYQNKYSGNRRATCATNYCISNSNIKVNSSGKFKGYCDFWLQNDSVSTLSNNGLTKKSNYINSTGNGHEEKITSKKIGIRPAMWVSLTDTDNNVDDANKKDVKEDILDERDETISDNVKEMSVEECGDINKVLFEIWSSINLKTNLDCYFPDLWSNKNTYAHLSYRKEWLEDSDVRCKFDKNNNLWVLSYADGNKHINDNLILKIYFTDGKMEEYYHGWDSNGMFSTKNWSFGNSDEIKNSEFDAKISEFEKMQDQILVNIPK